VGGQERSKQGYGGEKLKKRIPIGRTRRRWEYDIKMDLREVGWEDMDRINMAKDRDRWRAVVNAVMNPRVAQNVGNFLTC
jgi:hypothetical protein